MCADEYVGKQKLEAEKQDKLREYKATVDRRLEERLRQAEQEKARVLDDLQSKIQALNIASTDKEQLSANLRDARADKENKQAQLQEIVLLSGERVIGDEGGGGEEAGAGVLGEDQGPEDEDWRAQVQVCPGLLRFSYIR